MVRIGSASGGGEVNGPLEHSMADNADISNLDRRCGDPGEVVEGYR